MYSKMILMKVQVKLIRNRCSNYSWTVNHALIKTIVSINYIESLFSKGVYNLKCFTIII